MYWHISPGIFKYQVQKCVDFVFFWGFLFKFFTSICTQVRFSRDSYIPAYAKNKKLCGKVNIHKIPLIEDNLVSTIPYSQSRILGKVWSISMPAEYRGLSWSSRVLGTYCGNRYPITEENETLVTPESLFKLTGPRHNIKAVFPRYGNSHVKDKTIARPSYL